MRDDCELCGVQHTPWSVVEHWRIREDAELEEHGDIAKERLTRLHSLTPDGVPLYVEVPWPEPERFEGNLDDLDGDDLPF